MVGYLRQQNNRPGPSTALERKDFGRLRVNKCWDRVVMGCGGGLHVHDHVLDQLQQLQHAQAGQEHRHQQQAQTQTLQSTGQCSCQYCVEIAVVLKVV